MYFLALSHAPPVLEADIAICCKPVKMIDEQNHKNTANKKVFPKTIYQVLFSTKVHVNPNKTKAVQTQKNKTWKVASLKLN